MRILKNLANGVSAGVLASGLSLAAGVVAVSASMVPAYADTVALTAEQAAAIEASLQAALNSASTDAAKADAVAQAIQSAIALYGAGNAALITSTVMNKAEALGVSSSVIGQGLAQASASLAGSNNLAAATAIATTVKNEGDAGERGSYQSAATGLGYSNLASVAGGTPTATGGTGTGGIGNGGQGGTFSPSGTPGGSNSGCLNPSCTSVQ